MAIVLSFISLTSNSQVIETVVPEKGYILSIDLFQKNCEKIWSKQISIFKGNNPKVKNPNILSIGKPIFVQNCQMPKIEEKAPKKVFTSKESPIREYEPDPYILGLGLVGQFTQEQNEDSQKLGYGYRMEFGKYFKLDDDFLKISIGFINTKSKYNYQSIKDLSFDKGMASLDFSYLNYSKNKFKFGPSLGILVSQIGTDYRNPGSTPRQMSGLIGINSIYSINKKMGIDFKLNNQIESRINLMTSLGLEIKF